MDLTVITKDSTWGIAASAFSNPMYLNGPAGTTGNDVSTGFDISSGASVMIAFQGTYSGATVVHEQTIDKTGAGGWFPVDGSPADGGAASSTGCTSGIAYIFPIVGLRHRVRVTGLSSGTLEARIRIESEALAAGAGSGGGGGGGAVTIGDGDDVAEGSTGDAAWTTGAGTLVAIGKATVGAVLAPQDAYGAITAINIVLYDSTGTPVDFSAASPVTQSGTWNINNITGTVSLPTGAATAAKQPALGTAGTPSADVITVQGAAGMTAFVVGGAAADDAAASGNAAPVGGRYTATLPTFADGDRVELRFTSRGESIVGGAVPAGSADFGNPLKIGALVNNTPSGVSYTAGDRQNLLVNAKGGLWVSLVDNSGNQLKGQSPGDAVAAQAGLATWTQPGIYNGSTFDRVRSIGASFGSATGVQAVEQAGASFAYIAAAATTQVKSGAGILHRVVINTAVAGATIDLIDNTAGTTVNIGRITLPAAVENPVSLPYDLSFATGLRVITSGATDITVVYR